MSLTYFLVWQRIDFEQFYKLNQKTELTEFLSFLTPIVKPDLLPDNVVLQWQTLGVGGSDSKAA